MFFLIWLTMGLGGFDGVCSRGFDMASGFLDNDDYLGWSVPLVVERCSHC